MNQNVTPAMPEQPAIPPSVVYVPPVKKEWHVEKHDMIFAWLMLVFGFLFMRYVFTYTDGFFTTVFFLLLFFCGEIYIRKSGCKPKLPHHILGVIICAFSFLFTWSASFVLHGLCFLFLIPALIWRTNSVCCGKGFVTRFLPFDLKETVLCKPFTHIGAAGESLSSSFRETKASAVKTVFLGMLATIPLTAIVAVLLSSADSGIEEIMQKALNALTEDSMTIIFQAAVGLPVGCWLFGMFYSAARKTPLPSDEYYEERIASIRTLPNLGLYAGVTPICLLYLVYVISQTNYFLSAFAGKLPSDMIYSDYARRGFFELCAIAVINLVVILVMTGCAKNGGKQRPKLLTGYAAVLCLFTLFIIATALAKMLLYIKAYGLTSLRLYTAWFMVLLAVVFLILLVRQFMHRIPTAAILTCTFLVMFSVLCFSKPDALIAEYNISRYENKTLSDLDVSMLCSLSDDAYVVMLNHKDTLKAANQMDSFQNYLNRRESEYERKPDQSWNLSSQRLIQMMAK